MIHKIIVTKKAKCKCGIKPNFRKKIIPVMYGNIIFKKGIALKFITH